MTTDDDKRAAELVGLIAEAGRDASRALHMGAEQLAEALARANAHIALTAALGHLFAGRTPEGKAAAAHVTGYHAQRGVDAAIDLIDLLLDQTPEGADAAAFLAAQHANGDTELDTLAAASVLRHAMLGQHDRVQQHLARMDTVKLGNLSSAASTMIAAIADELVRKERA